MATLRLKYGFTAEPVLSDRDGEAIGNWEDKGNHIISVDATYVRPGAGSKSYKIASSGAGDFTSNYVDLPIASNATFVATKKYCVGIWVYAGGAISFRVKTGGVDSGVQTTGSAAWVYFPFIFTAITQATALQIIIDEDKVTNALWFELEPVCEYVELNVLAERGMSDPDMFDFFPALQYAHLDGTISEKIMGFRRKILLDVGVVTVRADRLQILYWMIDTARTVDYLTEVNVPLALQDISGYQNEWKFDCSLARYFVFALQEPSIRQTFPV